MNRCDNQYRWWNGVLCVVCICSYIIQNFCDTFRQSMIDLMQGNITKSDELQLNETLKVLAAIAESNIELSGYYHYGAINNELQLTESIVQSTRCKSKFNKGQITLKKCEYSIWMGTMGIQSYLMCWMIFVDINSYQSNYPLGNQNIQIIVWLQWTVNSLFNNSKMQFLVLTHFYLQLLLGSIQRFISSRHPRHFARQTDQCGIDAIDGWPEFDWRRW